VRIFGLLNLPGRVPVNASSLYARNLQAFIEPFIDKETKELAIDWDDELAKGTGIARDGAIVNDAIAERLGAKPASAATKPAPAKAKTNGGAKAPAKKTRQPKGGKTT
jgi:hypothetical protein